MTRPRWAWQLLLAASAGVALYLIWWSSYAIAHQDTRYRQLVPGASARVADTSVRLISLQQTPQLVSSSGEPLAASVGTVWIVATLEVIRPSEEELGGCSFTLVDTDRRVWTTGFLTVVRAMPRCASDEVRPGVPTRVEAVFSIPTASVGAIAGLAVDDRSTTDPAPLLTPAG